MWRDRETIRHTCLATFPSAHVYQQCPHKSTNQHTHEEGTYTCYDWDCITCAHRFHALIGLQAITAYAFIHMHGYNCRIYLTGAHDLQEGVSYRKTHPSGR